MNNKEFIATVLFRREKGESYQQIADAFPPATKPAIRRVCLSGHIPPKLAVALKLDATKKQLADRARRKAQREELERLRAENETIKDKLMKVREWINYYPVAFFDEPDMKEVRRLLEAGGITIDSVSASNFRFILERLYETVKP